MMCEPVILVDANVLLHAYQPRSELHPRCRAWVEEAFSENGATLLTTDRDFTRFPALKLRNPAAD